jgi:hypothetical protein
MKMTLLELVQDKEVPKSTKWARENRDKVAAAYKKRKGTLDGKLISLITQSRWNAKKVSREHEVDTNFLRGIYYGQGGKCALSGVEMTIQGERGTEEYWNSMSIDRIDSSIGYLEGNVQLTCTAVNLMKNAMPEEMLLAFCKNIVENSS